MSTKNTVSLSDRPISPDAYPGVHVANRYGEISKQNLLKQIQVQQNHTAIK